MNINNINFGFFFDKLNSNTLPTNNISKHQDDDNDDDDDDEFTRIYFLTPLLANNIKFAKFILKLPNYECFFLPISKTITSNIKIKSTDNKSHNLISVEHNTRNTTSFSFIINNLSLFFDNNNQIILFLLECYNHIIESTIILSKYNISLLSYEPDKLLIDRNTLLPYLSDFSYATKNNRLFKHLEFFKNIKKDKIYYYPFEIYVINYIISYNSYNIDIILSSKNILNITNFYVDNHIYIEKFLDIDAQKEICINLLNDYKTIGSYENIILYLFKQSAYWDNYIISITMLESIYTIFDNPKEFPIILKMINILSKNINPSFTVRNTLYDTKFLIKNILLH